MSGARYIHALLSGVMASVVTLVVATMDPPPQPDMPTPTVKRSFNDLAAFYDPVSAIPLNAHPLHNLLEPPPTYTCDDGTATISEVVTEVTARLQSRHIPYRSANLADCSGMTHRVLRAVAGRCEGVQRPSVIMARRAKDLARWYNQEQRLVEVSTAEEIDNALTVGSVAFFLAPGRRVGGLEDIFHIGVVVDIERDETGRIQRYAMFHGRRPGFSASITRWHRRGRIPTLGNGSERMVAVAWPSDTIRPLDRYDADLLALNDTTDADARDGAL